MARQNKSVDGIRLRKNGLYEKRFQIDGKRYSVYGKSKRECKDAELVFRANLNNRVYRANEVITLDQYFSEWQRVKEKEIKGNSMRSYIATYTRHISPVLGNTKVQKIEHRQIQNMIISISNKKTADTANRTLFVIKMVLKSAVCDEIISVNPADNVKNVKEHQAEAQDYINHRALSSTEQQLFFKYVNNPLYANFFRFMLYSGMRQGEVAALQIKDIDFKENIIHVRRTVSYGKDNKIILGSPKTHAGIRDIPLTDKALEIIRRQQALNKMLHNSIVSIDGLIFPASNGQPIRCCNLNNEIKRVVKKANADGNTLECFSTHAFRDSFASVCIEQNMKPNVLQKILGHEDIRITMNLYVKTSEQIKREQMQKIDFAV